MPIKIVPVHGGFKLSDKKHHLFSKRPQTKKMATKQLHAIEWTKKTVH